jgi:hypothetical protein
VRQQELPSKRIALWLAWLYPLGVLVMFTVNLSVKEWLGVEGDWKDEALKSLYGTAIMLVSCFILLIGIQGVSRRRTGRCT